VTTVTTTFAGTPRTVVIVLDDPATVGDPVSARQLLLGLDGAKRTRDAAGGERAPVLLTMDNRSVLAYEIVPTGDQPVTVSIASEEGWSLVGVLGSEALNATGAIALIASRGLDAVVQPMAPTGGTPGTAISLLSWAGPIRDADERATAKARAQGAAAVQALARKRSALRPARSTTRKTGGTR
jgi:hypothetical protein